MSVPSSTTLDEFIEKNIKMPYPKMWFRSHYITIGGKETDTEEEIKAEYEEWVATNTLDGGCND